MIVDPEQLRRVISNIVGNSVKYMDKSDPSITMDLKDVGDFVRLNWETTEKGLRRKIFRIYLTGFTGQMRHGILPKAEAGSGFRS